MEKEELAEQQIKRLHRVLFETREPSLTLQKNVMMSMGSGCDI